MKNQDNVRSVINEMRRKFESENSSDIISFVCLKLYQLVTALNLPTEVCMFLLTW